MFNPKKHGNVCPYCDISVEQNFKKDGSDSVNKIVDSEQTMPYWDEYDGMEPVVGWIVCIEGAQVGQDYKIRREKNFIGRSEEMHIQITGDNSISRKNHAVIIYDPKTRNFILKSGDSSGLVYLNNEAVYSPIQLTAYDVIQMGKSKFIFTPLCGMHFEWGNNAEEEKES
jgi:hypothetical protein